MQIFSYRTYDASMSRGAPARVGIVDVPAAPGALVSISDIRQYIAAVDESFQALDEDQYDALVWNDPDALDAEASKFDGGPSYLGGDPARAKTLHDEANMLRKRAATRSSLQVSRELSWSTKWRDLLRRWEAEKKYVDYPKMKTGPIPDTWVTGQWYVIKDLHTELNVAYDTYATLGYKATQAKKTTVVPTGVPSVTFALGALKIPWWGWTAIVLVGGAVAYVYIRPLLSFIPAPAKVK